MNKTERSMRKNLTPLLTMALAVAALIASGLKASAQETLLIGWTNLWAYNDTTTPTANLHGTGWELPAYDTNSAPGWKTAPALFGNDGAGLYDGPGRPFSGGINGFLTPLNRSVAAASDRVTFYFRKKFNYAGPAGVILETKWVHDDGFVAYLNGTEILRSKMQVAAPDPVSWSTLGANHDSANPGPLVVEGFEYSADLPSTMLMQGENTIAVELHQSSTTSSDCSFAMELKAVVPTAPAITNAAQPADRIVLQNRSSTLSVFAVGSRPLSYQWYFQPAGGGGFSPILDATNSSYTITTMAEANAGDYYCTVSNPYGSLDSRTASVGFTTDSTPPTVTRIVPIAFNQVIVEFSEAMRGAGALGAFTEDPFNYNLAGGTVGSGIPIVSLNPGGASVTLTIAPELEPNTDYTIEFSGDIQDLAENQLVAVTVSFRSWLPVTGSGVLFEAYDTTDVPGGNAVANLLAHPTYPNRPQEVALLSNFDSRLIYPTDGKEQYGARMRGLFIPPTSGPWIFYLWADDGSRLFVNPTGPGEGGKQMVLDRTSCCGDFNSPGSQSAPQNLVAGQAYYVEALYKEGTGGDYGKVIARRQGEPVPATGDPGLASPTAAPNGIAGTFTINQPPASQTVVPNSPVTFSVGTTTDVPLSYQWLRDGVEIPNTLGSPSIAAQYHLMATSADNGARFSVRVSILGGATITSPEALLTVEADTIRPTVVSATTTGAGSTIVITYSEPMGASVESPATYAINGVAPSAVTRNSPAVVTLTPASALQDCVAYAVRITGAADLASNLINPNPTTLTVNKPLVLVANSATQIWRYEDTGADLLNAWLAPGYDDSGWASGPGPLGLEDAAQMPAGWEIRTPTPNYVASRITYYFRTHFNLATAPASVTRMQLTQVVDDGAIYWLNGQLLSTLRMTVPANYAALAGGSTEPHPVEGPVDVPTSALQFGDNVLAVEVHQSGTTSSDLVFGAELVATVSRCVPPLFIERVGAQVRITWPDPAYRLETAPTPNGPWGPQAGASGLLLNATSGNAFFRLATP
jgi:hypothetical protein